MITIIFIKVNFKLSKRVSEDQKKNILNSFTNGLDIKDLSNIYGFSVPTITKQLKNLLGSDKFKDLKEDNKNLKTKKKPFNSLNKSKKDELSEKESSLTNELNYTDEHFFEIAPLTDGIDLETQKDLSSVPLDKVNFPKITYMIVDNKIELIIKSLKDFPEWDFLPESDLNRKTVQIFFDLKKAKHNCGKDQKVIKVPNTNVFKIVSPLLLSRGITRILTEDQLISI